MERGCRCYGSARRCIGFDLDHNASCASIVSWWYIQGLETLGEPAQARNDWPHSSLVREADDLSLAQDSHVRLPCCWS